METARRLGISLKRLRGWTPRSETSYDHRDGLLVGSSQWVEPEWDELERGWMLALAAYEGNLCALCGGPRSECQGPDADEAWQATAIRCHRATAMAQASVSNNNPHPEAVLYAPVRRGVSRG